MSVLKNGQGSITLGEGCISLGGLDTTVPDQRSRRRLVQRCVPSSCPVMSSIRKSRFEKLAGIALISRVRSLFGSLFSIDDACQRLESALPLVALVRRCRCRRRWSLMVGDGRLVRRCRQKVARGCPYCLGLDLCLFPILNR